jgi:aryl-alcohol dehydrogenase-like predicted oxidoreductase
MHHVDRETPWDEIWEAITAQGVAASLGMVGLVSEQSLYNLMSRWVELEVLPAAEHHGLGVIPWSPLAGGLLGGVLAKERDGVEGRGTANTEGIEKNREVLTAYEELCSDIGEKPADVALAWLLTRPAVTAPIIGPRTIDQLTDSLRVPEIDLDDAALDRLEELFPAPFPKGSNPAPEAYAW